ncbi:hypothetical protein CRG98_042720 [Punica granatum]|uniref:Uncharacterized protein n=1 Tax=Punica granatum TaxID=22663 RepID=A0A2I0HYW5_PUNGR|nr:hypothetical protein CRG98_042720 [Punica granatum]
MTRLDEESRRSSTQKGIQKENVIPDPSISDFEDEIDQRDTFGNSAWQPCEGRATILPPDSLMLVAQRLLPSPPKAGAAAAAAGGRGGGGGRAAAVAGRVGAGQEAGTTAGRGGVPGAVTGSRWRRKELYNSWSMVGGGAGGSTSRSTKRSLGEHADLLSRKLLVRRTRTMLQIEKFYLIV